MASAEPIVFDPLLDPITSITRKRVKAYFKARGPDRPKQVLYFGAPAMVCLIAGALLGMPRLLVASLSIVGVVAFAIASGLAVWALRRASEREVDIVLASDLERSTYLALDSAQLSATDLRHPEPCVYRNLRIEREYGGAYQANKVGKDEKRRWSPRELTVVHFGHQQLFVYRAAIDLTTGQQLYVLTREFLYSDIVSVVTHTERVSKPVPKESKADFVKYWGPRGGSIVNLMLQVDGVLTATLKLTSGEELEIARWEGIRDGLQPEEAPIQLETTARLRSMLRESKQRTASVSRLPRIVRHPSTET